jgi:hypothetical protein
MAWTNSKIFQQAALNPLLGRCWTTAAPTTYSSLSADTIKVALYNNTITPDSTAAVGLTGYNAATSQWVTAGEVTDTSGNNQWPAGGNALASKTFGIGTSAVNFDAADLAGTGTGIVTIASATGCLVYDDTITAGTVAKQGLCYNYFGGAQSVTSGTFTITWSNGPPAAIFNFTI